MERFPVFKIPNKLLDSIEYEQDVIEEEEEIKIEEGGIPCTTCLISTTKSHFKSDLHLYNLKRKVKQLKPLTEDEFDDKSDISSIDEESSEGTRISLNLGTNWVNTRWNRAGKTRKSLCWIQNQG